MSIEKDDWKNISKYLSANADQNEPIIVIEDYEALPLGYYYNAICFPQADILNCVKGHNIYPAKDMNAIKNKKGNFWLILSNRNNRDKSKDEINNFVNQNYEVLSSKEFSTMPKSKFYRTAYSFLKNKNMISIEHSLIRVYHLKQ